MHCELPPLTPDGRRPQALRGRRQVSRCLQLVTWGSPAGSFSFSESAARLQDQLIVVRQGRSGSKGQHPQAADDGLCSRPIGRLRLEAPLCAGLRTSQTSAAGAGHSPGDAVAVWHFVTSRAEWSVPSTRADGRADPSVISRAHGPFTGAAPSVF